MPRRKGIPAYKFHKASKQACVIIDGRHIYLGVFGSPESHEEYRSAFAGFELPPLPVWETSAEPLPPWLRTALSSYLMSLRCIEDPRAEVKFATILGAQALLLNTLQAT